MTDFTLDQLYEGAPGEPVDSTAIQTGTIPPFGNATARTYKTDGSYKDEAGLRKIAQGEPTAKAKAPAAQTFSLDDLYEPTQPQSDLQRTVGGLAAASRAVGGELASLGDMLLNTPTAIKAIGANALRRVGGAISLEPRDATVKAAKELQDKIQATQPNLLKKFMGLFAPPGEEVQASHADKAMGYLMELSDRDAASLEERTHGFIKKEDVQFLRDAVLTAIGTKGLTAPVKGVAEKLGKPSGKPYAMPPEEPVLNPEGEPAPKPATKAQLKELQAQVRKKYTDDAEFAQHYAKQAEAQAEAIQAAKRAEERLKNPTPSSDPIILTPEAKIDATQIGQRSLDTGLDKVVKGKKFDLTAEERIALKGAGVRGKADLALLSIMALGGTGLALANAYPDEAGKLTGGALLAGGMISGKGKGELSMDALQEGRTLGAILKDSPYTLKTLENLPQNRTTFPKTMVEEQLRREGVTKAEKDVVQSVLAAHPGEEISSAALMKGVKEATGDFELKEAPTDQYADYGLEGIDRLEPPDMFGVEDLQREIEHHRAALADGGLDPRTELQLRTALRQFEQDLAYYKANPPPASKTSIWQLPEHMEISDANHFSDPRYFGHTRSFEEGGVKHVVEIQSDLAQKAGKVLTEGERAKLAEDLANVQRQQRIFVKEESGNIRDKTFVADTERLLSDLEKENPDVRLKVGDKLQGLYTSRSGARAHGDPEAALQDALARAKDQERARMDINNALNLYYRELDVLNAEHSAKLGEAATTSQLSPILKNWDRRLVREELAASARKGEPVVRFATADTVAKVEGWPNRREALSATLEASKATLANVKEQLHDYETFQKTGKAPETAYLQGVLKTYPEVVTPEWISQEISGLRVAVRELEQEVARKESAAKESTQFSPEHQGIYNRYKGDVEKFLRQLGGKPYTDSAGHTWIEVPTGVDRVGGKRVQMFGGAKLDLLKGIAAVGLGLTIGSKLDPDNPIEGAVLGVIGGAAIVGGAVPRLVKTLREVAKPDSRIRINNITEAHELALKRVAREVYQLQNKIVALVPDKARREAINTAIDEGKIAQLTGKEKEAASLVQDFYARVGEAAQDAKVLEDVRNNYTTHLWDKADRAKLDAILQAKQGQSMSPNSRFAKARTHVTMAEGKAAGLKPVTEDVAEIVGIYGNSIGRSIANRTLIDNLKAAKTADGIHLVRPISKAPLNYVTIQHPSLQNLRVHPDIAPSLKFMFEAQDAGAAMAALEAVNTALKRNAVSFSLFHAKALADAALGAVKNPLTVGKFVGQAAFPKIFGQNKYLQMLKEGGAGDLVDHAFADGLVFSFERAESAVEDVGGGFYKGMKSIQDILDKATPHLGSLTVGNYIRVNHALDNFMWGRLHAGMKLSVYASKVEALMENSAKAGKPLSRAEAGKIAASYTNDVFGGLNWQRIAEGATTKFGRDLSLSALSPKGRRGLQLLLFAPDWTLSTTRAFTQAFVKPGKGGGLPGIFSARTLADLHRQQLIRSALYYAAVGDGLNYAFSGHHLWENKIKDKDGAEHIDWTRVDLGDGRTMQLSKHFVEPFHWIMNPGQQALNKLGVLPKEGMEQSLGVKYLSAKGRMPPMDTSTAGRVKHAVGSTLPIGIQQFQQGGAAAGTAGMLGVPIYGQTAEQKRQARFEASLARFRKHQQDMENKK